MSRTFRTCRILGAACLCLALWASAAPAQFGVVTVKSVDDTMKAIQLVATQAGEKEKADQLDGMINVLTGGKGFAGIDTKKPLGLYVNVPTEAGAKPPVVTFLPITKKDDLLDLLKNLQVGVSEPEKEIYTLSMKNGTTFYVRFANGHAYGSDNSEHLQGKLPDPAKFLPPDSKTHLIAASLRLGQLPRKMKQELLDQIAAGAEAAKNEEQKEKPGQREARLFGAKLAEDSMMAMVRDGEDLSLALDINPKTEKITLDLSLSAAPNSSLADSIKKLGVTRSRFSSLVADSSFNMLFAVPFAKTFRTDLGALINKAVQEELEKEKDANVRKLTEKAAAMMGEMFATDTIDFAVVLGGPYADKKVGFLAAVHVKNGKKAEEQLRALIKENPPEKDKGEFKLDHSKVAGTAIHWFKPKEEPDARTEKDFGSNEVYVAIKDDAMLFSVGVHGLEVMKDALTRLDKGGAKASATDPIQVEISMARLAGMNAEFTEEQVNVVRKVFSGADKNKDRVRLSLLGGNSIRLRMESSIQMVKMGAALAKLKEQEQ
jgi:hypothetical protein